MQATPNPDMNIESLLSNCLNCHQPVVSVKLEAGSEWSEWSHALTGQPECVIGAETPPTARGD